MRGQGESPYSADVPTPLAPSARLVGTVVPRKEDPRLLTGAGRYVDDVDVPGMVHAHFVRSDVARGRITRLDVSAARRRTASSPC